MMEHIKRSPYRKIFAFGFILFGFIALVTPGLPGAWFLFVGFEILGVRLLWIEYLKEKLSFLNPKQKEGLNPSLPRDFRKEKIQGEFPEATQQRQNSSSSHL